MNLLIIGAPGTGKGTMSALIKEEFPIVHISTGDMLREAIANETNIGKIANHYISNGQLVPDDVIHGIIVERLGKDDIKNGFLFDGYPRTQNQAIDLDEILKSLNINLDKVLYLDIDDEVLKTRITGRRLCSKCNEIYHVVSKPSKVEGVCDICGGELIQRADDTLESLVNRLEAYHGMTQPVIEYYEKQGLVTRINADQAPAKVFADIKDALKD
ncbi:MAG: adenylate kinase [Erysipelotrichaceae bacterium]|nr:adenylate kinase [Erysipelotrichaceae bacterium]